MSKFVVRVELHRASEAIYESLHKKMAAAGYYRQIASDNGVLFFLPTATYEQTFGKDFSAVQIRDHVKPIVNGVWNSSEIFVTKYLEAAWTGLPKTASKAA